MWKLFLYSAPFASVWSQSSAGDEDVQSAVCYTSSSLSSVQIPNLSGLPTNPTGRLTAPPVFISQYQSVSIPLPIATLTSSLSGMSTTLVAPSPAPTVEPSTLHAMASRRLSSVVGALGLPNQIPAWLSSLGNDGKWPDSQVDYTTGCAARRANWPAQSHWQRILIMAGAWHGGLQGAEQYVKDTGLRSAIASAMSYWFERDFQNSACLDGGGTALCPCDNLSNSLWNTNWYSNIILIPSLVSQTCLLLNDTLTPSEIGNCTFMTERAYGTFDRYVTGLGYLTGANTLDVATIGIDAALYTNNLTQLSDAYRRVHSELQIKNGVKVDGIRGDGSFGQHAGMLYNGNYGKDYTNDVLDLEIAASGTVFVAEDSSKNALATLFDGDSWMIYNNALKNVLHWDTSAIGRMISFPVIDGQASAFLKINLTQVQELGQEWGSEALTNFVNALATKTNNANAGNLVGNRMFFANDYMVHRGDNYVTTLKMHSTRTLNTECVNSQNPKGFHLADGVVYNYLRGDEYEDIVAAWDWDLVPGITVNYNATALACGTTQHTGLEAFVGGVSNDRTGAAAMRYTNPLTRSLRWQKAWFFLDDDVQYVMVSSIRSSSVPVYSVLDQKRISGPWFIDGKQETGKALNQTSPRTLWHDGIGYLFPWSNNGSFALSVETGLKTGNWSSIGTSTQPPAKVEMFTAWIEHRNLSVPLVYAAMPGVTQDQFMIKDKQLNVRVVQNDDHISAVFDAERKVAMIIFWDGKGGTISILQDAPWATVNVTANANMAVIYRLEEGKITISDPSQTINTATLSLTLGSGQKPPGWGSRVKKTLVFQLPSGGMAGSSITRRL